MNVQLRTAMGVASGALACGAVVLALLGVPPMLWRPGMPEHAVETLQLGVVAPEVVRQLGPPDEILYCSGAAGCGETRPAGVAVDTIVYRYRLRFGGRSPFPMNASLWLRGAQNAERLVSVIETRATLLPPWAERVVFVRNEFGPAGQRQPYFPWKEL